MYQAIRKITTSGSQVSYFTTGDPGIRDLAWDGNYIWAINTSGTIKQFDTLGTLVDSIAGLLSGGWGLTYGDEYLWASDPGNDMIYKIATVTGVEDENKYTFEKFYLFQNYPNPFSQFTTISYSMPRSADGRWPSVVNLNIYDLTGRVVRTLVNGSQPGYYEVIWDGTNEAGSQVAPGIYLYSLKSKNFDITKKMIIVR